MTGRHSVDLRRDNFAPPLLHALSPIVSTLDAGEQNPPLGHSAEGVRDVEHINIQTTSHAFVGAGSVPLSADTRLAKLRDPK